MPTYDYECKACGHTFEEMQSFNEPLLTKCPACKKNKLERLFGGGGAIIFKGSGFYETDYRRPSEKGSESEAAPKAEAKTESKTESTTAASGSSTSTTSPPPAAKTESTGGSKKKA